MTAVLVANRGEIALRIVRACQEEGLQAVAVYSDVDGQSPHVLQADHAVAIGPANATQSYLNIPNLIKVAKETGCTLVHPGYGFLAERAEFAEAVTEAGLTFVGPSADAIRAMGEKTSARRRMRDVGVPVVPGTTEPLRDAADAAKSASEIGYPVLLKASAGGGGKGMRHVESAADVEAAFTAAQSEARKAFGNGDLYVEKFIRGPRHVEIQVLADAHGNVMHFGERECSVQRRHQKMIEECPSPAVNPALRMKMGEAAVQAAAAVAYTGAGTVEFLLEASGDFYFLEMNTRIQVEHPVTELVYGVDLVRQQLRIAQGHAIPADLAQRTPSGHAVECRITSEDPANGFLPATGVIQFLNLPTGPGVRWDGGVTQGMDVGLSYDPLLGKLIVWAEDREQALQRMKRALSEMVVVGIPTSQGFHHRVMEEKRFQSGIYDIQYFETIDPSIVTGVVDSDGAQVAAIAAALVEHETRRDALPGMASTSDHASSAWRQAARWENHR